jgi:UDP-N-acetylmuramoyl-L-alanyl-D-glutamate--2,6-diaminopimelate ligase
MEAGVGPQNFKKTVSITDRKQAIKTACQRNQWYYLIAGKGTKLSKKLMVCVMIWRYENSKELLEQLHK